MRYIEVEQALGIIESRRIEADQAIRHICALLEHSQNWMQDYAHRLPPDLQPIRLDELDQREIVYRLAACIRARHPLTCSLLHAIGKASRTAALQPLVDLITTLGLNLSDDDAYQALIALENCWILKSGRWAAPPELDYTDRERLQPFLAYAMGGRSIKLGELAERTFQRLMET